MARAANIRRLRADDDRRVAAVIVDVLGREFGETRAEVAAMLPELEALSTHYSAPGARYFVADVDDVVVGGAGIAPLSVDPASPRRYCELEKMYVDPAARGGGVGQRLLDACLAFARESGYSHCYLDTRAVMTAAIALYERNGFVRLPAPLADTGHFICDAWFELDLTGSG